MILKVKIGEKVKQGDAVLYPTGDGNWAIGNVKDIQEDFIILSGDISVHHEFTLKLI